MPEEGSTPADRLPAWAWALFTLVTLAVFAPGLTGGFAWDDLTLVARDGNLRSLSNARELVATPLWSGLPELAGSPELAPGHWRPLTSLTLALGFTLGGSAAHTLPFHLLSLALHLAASLVAYRILRRLVADGWAAYLGALLFAVHAVHVESVSWISAVNDPLFGLLGLLALDAWLGWRERGSGGLPLAAGAWLLLALCAKELAVAVPVLILVVDLLLVRDRRRSLTAWGTLAVAVAVWYGLRCAVFGEATAGLLRTGAETGPAVRGLGLRVEMLGQGLTKLVFPVGLTPFEPFTEVGFTGWARAGVLGALLAFGCLLTVALRRRLPRLAAALLLAAAGLLPALLAPGATGQTPYADRYLYLSVLGVALGLATLASRARQAGDGRGGARPPRALLLPLLVVLGLGLNTPAQTRIWRSQEALFRHAVEAHPDYPMVHWQLGEVLRARYLETGDELAFREAGELYDRALDLLDAARTDPTIARGEYDYLQANLGKAWWHLLEAQVDDFGEYDTSRTIFEMLLEKVYEREQSNIATGSLRGSLPVEQVLTGLGICQLASGDRAAAEATFHKALALNDRYAPPLHNLGVIHFERGEFAQATHAFERALALKPGDTATIAYLAKSLFEEGWIERALEVVDQIRELDPSDVEPDLLLGGTASRQRDWRAALEAFDAAAARAPRSARAQYYRGLTLLQLGEREEAIAALRRACELSPTHFEAHFNLGSILLEQGSYATALPYLERAYAAVAPGEHAAQLPALRQVLVDLDPENAPRLRALADQDEARGDLVGALFFCERALVIDPDSARSRHQKGRILLENGEPVTAVLELERACELAPQGYGPHLDLGRARLQLGRYPQAREAFERARELVQGLELPTAPEPRAAAELMQADLLRQLEDLLERTP